MNPNIKTKQGHIKEYTVSQTLKHFAEEHKRDDHWPPAPTLFTIFPGIQGPNFRKITLTQAPDKKKCHKSEDSHSTPITQILLLKYWAILCGYLCSAADSNWISGTANNIHFHWRYFFLHTYLFNFFTSHPSTLYGLINTEFKKYFFLPCYTELRFE